MIKKLSFILNSELVQIDINPNITLLDFIRDDKHLFGTKLVCKEGDCGACTVLIGNLEGSEIKYKTVTSCIYPIGNCNRKHIVTIEGINQDILIPQQKVFVDEHASQCGFCTPGFLMSLTGYLLNNEKPNYESAIKSLDGNICRCTGYESIKRAVRKLIDNIPQNHYKHLDFLIQENIVPHYFSEIRERLSAISQNPGSKTFSGKLIGGGSDLFVQKPDELLTTETLFANEIINSSIEKIGTKVRIGAAATFEQFKESQIIKEFFGRLEKQLDLIASLQIRNSATIGGNIVNASPIGDLVIILLALNCVLTLSNGKSRRNIALKDFYLGYKNLNKSNDEFIEYVEFEIPNSNYDFNFEKVSKRKHLDIASVNSAALFYYDNDVIKNVSISAGGVAPIPILLTKTSEHFKERKVSEIDFDLVDNLIEQEINPISDIRGSSEYKTLLLKRLIRAHFVQVFPEQINMEEII